MTYGTGHAVVRGNDTDAKIDRELAKVAQQRLEDLKGGKVSAVPAEEVFARIRERLGRWRFRSILRLSSERWEHFTHGRPEVPGLMCSERQYGRHKRREDHSVCS